MKICPILGTSKAMVHPKKRMSSQCISRFTCHAVDSIQFDSHFRLLFADHVLHMRRNAHLWALHLVTVWVQAIPQTRFRAKQ